MIETSPLSNKIYYISEGEKNKDVTTEALKSVFEWFLNTMRIENKNYVEIRFKNINYVLSMKKEIS